MLTLASNAQNIEFYKGNKKLKTLDKSSMKNISSPKKYELEYHFSKARTKNYECFPILPILKKVYGKELGGEGYSEVIFEATDGYKAFSEMEKLTESGGCLAFRDLDVKKGWEPVGRRSVSPAPYFLVWKDKDQNTANGYPWPWSLAKIKLIKFENRYKKVFPTGYKTSSDVYKGYLTFRGQCFRCHAIDKQGGKIGPDLAAPQNILAYRSKKMVYEFIKNPEKYRYTKMPAHDHLSKKEITQIIAYLASRKKVVSK